MLAAFSPAAMSANIAATVTILEGDGNYAVACAAASVGWGHRYAPVYYWAKLTQTREMVEKE